MLDKLWGWVVLIFTGLVGMVFFERNGKQNAEANLLINDEKNKDASLNQEQKTIQVQIDQEKEKSSEEQRKELSPEELAEYLKKL